MPTLQDALDWGVPATAGPLLRLRLQVTNGMSVFGIGLVLAMTVAARLSGMPSATSWLFAALGLMFVAVLMLNRAGAIVASRFTYLITAYAIILGLMVAFAPGVNFQQYLIPGVGMALIFFDAMVGWKRTVLVWAGLPVYALGTYLQPRIDPLFVLTPGAVSALSVLNTFAALATSIAMFTLFSRQADRHLAELQHAARQLAEANASLRASNEQLDAYARVVSHDLKTPLSAVVGTLDLLGSGAVELPPEDLELVQLALGSAHHMTSMIDDLLDYTRHSIDDGGTGTAPVSIFGLVHTLARLLDPAGAERVVCEGDDLTVVARPVPLSHVLHNLLCNALKYSPDDRARVFVRCWAEPDSGLTWVSVRDEGIGIPTDALDRIFDLGRTAHGEQRDDSTGVGLHVVRTLVARHGGTIEVQSTLGEGSTFTFSWQ